MTPTKGQPINPPPAKRGTLAHLTALDSGAKVLLGLGTFAAVVASSGWYLSSIVTAEELAAELAPRDAAVKKTDEHVDLLFQTTVKLTTDSDWLKQEIRGIRRDLRDMDRGRPLSPLPSPTARPAPSPEPTPNP